MKHVVVGAGSIGSRHLKNLIALGEREVLVVDPRHDRRERAAALGARVYERLEDALELRPESALVTNPSAMHLATALVCARAGCDLFVEKPVAMTTDQVDELAAIVRDRGLCLLVGYNWKFHPAFRAMKEVVASGRIGRVYSAQVIVGSYLPEWHPGEDYRQGYSARQELGGGVLFDSHELCYVPWLLGPVSSIQGFVGCLGDLQIDTDDTAILILHLRAGCVVSLHTDYLQRVRQQQYSLFGTDGTLIWDRDEGLVRVFRAGTGWENVQASLPGDIEGMYIEEMRHYLQCLARKAEAATGLAEGAAAVRLAKAAEQSHASRRAVDV